MAKKYVKFHLFLLCMALISIFSVKTIAHAEEKKEVVTTIQTGAYGEIVNVESGKRLNVKGNSSAQEAAITMYQQDGTTGQKWQFLSFPNGYSLIPECGAPTGRVLNIYGNSAKAGSRICLWSSTQSDTQCWIVEAEEDGSFVLRSKNNPELCLAESGTGNGSAVTLKAYSLTDNSIRWVSTLVTVEVKNGPTPVPEEPKEVKLSATSISTYANIPIQLTLENADPAKVKWSVSSETKGYVKDGEVHALQKNCSFTVYAKYEGKTYKCKVTSEKNDPKFTTYKDRYYFAVKDDVPVYMGPHSSAPLVKKLSKNEVVIIAGDLVNKAGNSWFVTSDNLYVYSGNVVAVPAYTKMDDTVLFAQLRDTVVYSAPGETAEVVAKLPMHSYLTMFGEVTDMEGAKWYVTYGPDKTGALRYVRAKDFSAHPHLANVPGCEAHKGNCTFCAAVTMVRRRVVHDGLCDAANSVNAVTYGMIDCYSGGLKYAPWTYYVNGGTAAYTTNTLYFDKNTNPCTVDILKKLCIDHPEGIVIYDSGEANSNNGVMHAVCLGECIPWEDGTNGFYVYDINDAPYWGTQMIRLEDSSIYRNNGYNMNNLLANITHIIYIESSSVK